MAAARRALYDLADVAVSARSALNDLCEATLHNELPDDGEWVVASGNETWDVRWPRIIVDTLDLCPGPLLKVAYGSSCTGGNAPLFALRALAQEICRE